MGCFFSNVVLWCRNLYPSFTYSLEAMLVLFPSEITLAQ